MERRMNRRLAASQRRKQNMKVAKKHELQAISHLEQQLLELQCRLREDHGHDFIIRPPPVEPYGDDFVNRKKMSRVKSGLLKDDEERRHRKLEQNRISNARYALRQKTDAKNRCLKLAHLKEELERAQQVLADLQAKSACLYDEISSAIKHEQEEVEEPYLHVDLSFADQHDFSIISPIIYSGKLSVWEDDPFLFQLNDDDSLHDQWTSDSSLDEGDLFVINRHPETICNW